MEKDTDVRRGNCSIVAQAARCRRIAQAAFRQGLQFGRIAVDQGELLDVGPTFELAFAGDG